ncbi:MAG TPA: hypothetical protein VJ279_11220 [Hanamia sp.]|jgi:hypothetical protein|nr:hypothetical protein [Hanamia sp.]
MKLKKYAIEFTVKNEPVKFTIVHDLPEQFGLSIGDALESWLARTKEYTAESFCDYVKSKNTGAFIMEENEYNKLTSGKKKP